MLTRLGWSTCYLRSCCWLLDHIIYLKLRKISLFANISEFCKFAQLSKQIFLSQLKINHVIQQPKPRGNVDHLE